MAGASQPLFLFPPLELFIDSDYEISRLHLSAGAVELYIYLGLLMLGHANYQPWRPLTSSSWNVWSLDVVVTSQYLQRKFSMIRLIFVFQNLSYAVLFH